MSQNKIEHNKTFSINFYLFLAFLEGAFVIFGEMLGAKILASQYGNSLIIWTSIITITVTFLTLGYFIGAFYSNKTNSIKYCSRFFMIAAFGFAIFSVFSKSLFVQFSDKSILQAAIQSSFLLIGLPILFLGMTSPIIIQLLNQKLSSAGTSSGKVYAISTLAGIISTMLLGYLLLPYFGTELALIVAFAFLSSVSIYLYRNFLHFALFFVSFFFILKPFLETKKENKYFKIVYQSEGLMGQLKVVEQSYPTRPTMYKILLINGIPQTIIHNEDKNAQSFWQYVNKISITASKFKGKNALLFGMGGGAIANELQKLNMNLDVVDIDKRMFDISSNNFYFNKKKSTHFHVDDARHFIKTCKKKYSFIVIDICTGEVQPSNLFTVEGIAELKNLIKKEGLILIQYQEKFNPNKISGSQSIAKTFIKNDFHVYQNIENTEIASVLIACSPNPFVFTDIDTNQITQNAKKQTWLNEFLKGPFEPIFKPKNNSVILIDDKPILEHINAETIEAWRKTMNDFYSWRFYDRKE